MNPSLKIAIYSGEIPSTTFIERLISGLADSGAEVILFGALQKKPTYSSQVKVVAYRQTRFSKFWHLVRFTVLLTLFKRKKKEALDSYLKQQQITDLYTKVKYYPVLWYEPDVFHIQWAKGLEDWMWVQDFGIKLVLSLRGAHINYSPIADASLADRYRNNFPKVDGFHAVSKAIGLEAQKYGAMVKRIHVVYSGLDMNSMVTIRYKPIHNKTDFKLISVGRSHWIKGYTYALDACKLLKTAGLSFHYTIIGALGDMELAYQIQDLGIQKEVTLMEAVPFKKVQEHVQNADVLVLPSVEEGIANAVLEAMTMGTLVVSTNCGGMDEVITDGENGFLVPTRHSKALAEKLKFVMDLTKDHKDIVIANAKRTMETQHTSSKMITDMVVLYQNLMTR